MIEKKKYYRNPDFIFRNVAGEAVLIPLMKNVADLEAIFTLNEVGAFLWNHMEDPITLDSLKIILMDEFDVDLDVAEDDLCHFLSELLDLHIILEE